MDTSERQRKEGQTCRGKKDRKRKGFRQFKKANCHTFKQEKKPPFRPRKTDPLKLREEKEPLEEIPLRVSRHNLHEELFEDF